MFDSLQPQGLYSPWNSPGQNAAVGSLSLHQGIFPIQRSNPGLPHCSWILYQLSHKGSPRILEWVALSLLQRILLTQELNWGLLHCRWILFQLSYQGSPVLGNVVQYGDIGRSWAHLPSWMQWFYSCIWKNHLWKRIWKLAENFLHLVRWEKATLR